MPSGRGTHTRPVASSPPRGDEPSFSLASWGAPTKTHNGKRQTRAKGTVGRPSRLHYDPGVSSEHLRLRARLMPEEESDVHGGPQHPAPGVRVSGRHCDEQELPMMPSDADTVTAREAQLREPGGIKEGEVSFSPFVGHVPAPRVCALSVGAANRARGEGGVQAPVRPLRPQDQPPTFTPCPDVTSRCLKQRFSSRV